MLGSMLGSLFGHSSDDALDDEEIDDDLLDDEDEDDGPGTLRVAVVTAMIALPLGVIVGRALERRRSAEKELRARSLGRGTGRLPRTRLRTVYPPGWEEEQGHDAGPDPDESGDDWTTIPAHTVEP